MLALWSKAEGCEAGRSASGLMQPLPGGGRGACLIGMSCVTGCDRQYYALPTSDSIGIQMQLLEVPKHCNLQINVRRRKVLQLSFTSDEESHR